jgi:hypothetical protein
MCRALRDLQEGEELTICYIGNISKSCKIFLSTDLSIMYSTSLIFTNIFLLLSTNQCRGSGSAWIHFKLKDRIQIRIWVNLQMTSQKIWQMSLFEPFFKIFSIYLETRIGIRIRNRIKVKGAPTPPRLTSIISLPALLFLPTQIPTILFFVPFWLLFYYSQR